MPFPTLLALAALLTPLAASASHFAPGEDLSDVYPATREWSKQGLFPVCTAEDVWRLKSFEVSKGKDLEISCKKATVAFGRDGTDVLWAVVFPDEPAEIEGRLAPEDETAKSILLRFGPSEIARVFPAKTVDGRGDAWRRFEGHRVASRKMVWDWCTPAGNPTIVPKDVTIVDVDTVEGPRRFFAIRRNSGSVEVVDDFVNQATPAAEPIARRKAEKAFDEVWKAFDREYAGFVELPDVDWKKTGKESKKLLKRVETTYDLAAVLSDMLANLQDLHVWVKAGNDHLPGNTRERPLNGNWNATQKALAMQENGGQNLVWGKTKDGFGYLGVHGLSDEGLKERVDVALEALKDTPGMIVDLRFNGGGSELLARDVASRFLDEPRVYGWNRYRKGSRHDALGPVLERSFEPRGPWRYDRPVVCLWGRKTLSSAESMAKMFDVCPQVTTMGSPSGGSSANPRRIELSCGITVNLPRWLDLLEDGTALERRGVTPEVLVEHEASEFTDRKDPVMDAAIEYLKKR
ncbi:MAG: S41 family peptidase [Planctomycetota bacterium]